MLFNNTLRANEPEKVTSTEEVSETAAKKERIKQVTKVTYLKRLQMKNLKLDTSLQIGKFRELSEDELVDLMNDL